MNNKGYSLVELLVVVAIIGILGATMTLQYSSSGSKLKAAARELYSNMQHLKMEAVKRNATGVVIFNPGAETYTMFIDDGPGAASNNWALDASDTPIGVVTMPGSIDLVSTTIPFNTYGYSSRGIAHSDITVGTYDVKLRLTDNSKFMGLRLYFAGSVRLISSTDGVTWN